jgi:hypothetical protein
MWSAKDCFTRVFFGIAIAWGANMSWKLHEEIRVRQLRNPTNYPRYSDFAQSVVTCGVLVFAQWIFCRIFAPVARTVIAKKARWSHALYGAKIMRCCDAVFKCLFYIAMTSWGFQLLQATTWLPSVMGGSGETRNCFKDGDGDVQQIMDANLRQFYLINAGFQLSEVVMHLASPRHPDFWEMLLHHTLTTFLVSFSYLLNYTRVGSLVLLLHGVTDIFVYLSKAVVDTGFVGLIVVSYSLLVGTFAWFRIYVFPAYIMRSAWIESLQEHGEHIAGWGFLNFALCTLLVLHMYWFGLIIKIGANFRKTGEARDMQSNLSAMDLMKDGKKAH